MPEWIINGVLSVGGAAVGAYVAVSVKLAVQDVKIAWLRRDVDELMNHKGMKT